MQQEIFQRKQFTFYESFYNCIEKTLRKKSEKLAAYQAVIQYALYGQISDFENLPDCVCGLLEAIYPVLDTARKNAKNGKQGGETKLTASTASANSSSKKEIEIENEIEIETEKESAAKLFDQFWQEYPKKVGREEAYNMFCQEKAPLSTLLSALARQKSSVQWQKENGRYIPNPATWLRDKRWQAELSHINNPHGISSLDIQAIERMMRSAEHLSQ